MIELKSLRNKNTKHFLNPDGTITAYLYDFDIHYLKDGKFKDIDNTLIENNNAYVNKENAFQVFFNKDAKKLNIVDIKRDNYYLKISLENKSSNLKISTNKDILSYENILPDIDFNYHVISNKLKESIVLKNKQTIPKTLTFKIETNLNLVLNNNKLEAKDKLENIFEIAAPYMWDSTNNYNYNLSYNLVKERDEHYKLILNLDEKWLKNAIFPVIIDPTIIDKSSNNVYDTYIYSGDTNVNRNNTDKLKVGVNNNNVYRSLLKFNLPKIGTASEIIDARFVLTSHPIDINNSYENLHYIDVHEITTSWDESTANWNTMADKYYSHIEEFQIGARSTETTLNQTDFDITSLVKRWYSGAPNYGIMLKYDDETKSSTKTENTFISKNNNLSSQGIEDLKPFLIINYRNLNGLESYMTYKKQQFVDGMSFINNLTGNLTMNFNLNETIGGKYPINLSLIYNTNDVVLNNNYGYGLGWKLSLHEIITETKIDGEDYLEYLDSDGTLHYFIHSYNDLGEINAKEYIDEDGLGLTATFSNNQYTIKDKDGNSYIYTKNNNKYYLTSLIDTFNSTVNITYQNNRIIKITDANNSTINITYNTNKTVITSPSKTTTLNYNGNILTSITTKNGTTTLTYNNHSLITKVTDITGLSTNYEYYNAIPYKISKVSEIGTNGTIGSYLNFEYSFLATRITDNLGHINKYAFNERGNTISISNLDEELNLNNAYGKTFEYYDNIGSTVIDESGDIIIKPSKAVNNLNAEIEPQKYTKNLINNSSFESETNILPRTTEYQRTGSYAGKIVGNDFIPLELVGNQTYTFSGYFKNSEAIQVLITRVGVSKPEELKYELIPPNPNFKRYALTFDVPYDSISNISITFDVQNNGVAYLDDIQLELGETANYYNLLSNGDFTSNLTNWTLKAINEKGINQSVESEIVNLSNDLKALKIKARPNHDITLSTVIPMHGKKRNTSDNIGDVYNLSFWYRNTGINKNYASSYNNASVLVSFDYQNVPAEEAYDLVPLDLLSHNEEWQYFSYPFIADSRYDYNNIRLTFFNTFNANELYLANISLSCDVLNEYNWHNTDTGNLDSIRNTDGSNSTFKYDKNNQLTSMFNPRGNNFTFEYDNEIPDRILKGISPTGISNEIKYDEYGNPIKTIINNVNPANTIEDEKYYSLRLKGTEKYIDCDFQNKTVKLKADSCSHDTFLANFTGAHYYFTIGGYYLVSIDNVTLSKSFSNYGIYDLEKQPNGSYKILNYLNDQYLCNNNGTIALSDSNTKEEDMEFYFEDIDTPLFIETTAEYTPDGKFLTKTTDTLGNSTLYDIDSTTGLTSSVTDAKDNTISYTYNSKDQITKVTKNNKEVNYTYNSNNLLSNITSGTKNYQFNYDNFLNVNEIKINNNSLVTNTYEPNNGNLKITTYGNGSTVYYNYDELDRLKSITNDNNTYVNVYDNLGNLVKVKGDNYEEYEYNYDLAGRLEKYRHNDLTIAYNYDSNNNITNKKYYDYLINHHKSYYTSLQEELNYEYNEDDAIKKITFDNNNINYTYDYLGRLIKKDINNNNTVEYTYLTQGNKTSALVKTMKVNDDLYEYKYDKLYNITDIYLNGDLINHYEYDNFNQLTEDHNYRNNIKYKYTYDTEGNLDSKMYHKLDTGRLFDGEVFLYKNTNWQDQLTRTDEGTITYDAIGNPLTIGKNKTLTWTNGRELATFTDGNNVYEYSYDKNGIRTTKKINNVTTHYFTEGNKIIFETTGNNVLYYIRDEDGSLIGFKYNNDTYYYLKNLQEDIIGITDSNYNKLCSYEYNAWGEILSIKDNFNQEITDASHIAIINPYRYRSYYYDTETKLYYLNSRYYNPAWGRFLNIDGYLGVSGDILGYNLYCYGSNNPINNVDSNGTFFKKAVNWVKKKANQVKKSVNKAVNGVKKTTKTVKKAVNKTAKAVKNTASKIMDAFVFEAEVGFGLGLSGGIGEAEVGGEFTKTFGYSINGGQYTSTSTGAKVGYDNVAVGLSADVRHYDNGKNNPMAMPWEVWNDPNTTRETVVIWERDFVEAETSEKGGNFIGVSFGYFKIVGGKIKIGFNIGG